MPPLEFDNLAAVRLLKPCVVLQEEQVVEGEELPKNYTKKRQFSTMCCYSIDWLQKKIFE